MEAILRDLLKCRTYRNNAKQPWENNKPWYNLAVSGALYTRIKAAVGDTSEPPGARPHAPRERPKRERKPREIRWPT